MSKNSYRNAARTFDSLPSKAYTERNKALVNGPATVIRRKKAIEDASMVRSIDAGLAPPIVIKAKALVMAYEALCMYPSAETADAYSEAAKQLEEAL